MKKQLIILFLIPNVIMADSGGFTDPGVIGYIILFVVCVGIAVFTKTNNESEDYSENKESLSKADKEEALNHDIQGVHLLINDFKYTEAKAIKTLGAYEYFNNIVIGDIYLKKNIQWANGCYYNSNLLEYTPDQIKHIYFVTAKMHEFDDSFVDLLRKMLPNLASFMTGVKGKNAVLSELDNIFKGLSKNPTKEEIAQQSLKNLKAAENDFNKKEHGIHFNKSFKVISKLNAELDSYIKKNSSK